MEAGQECPASIDDRLDIPIQFLMTDFNHRFCSIILPAQPARQSSLTSFRNVESNLTDLSEKTGKIQVK